MDHWTKCYMSIEEGAIYFAKQDQEKHHKESNIKLGLGGQIEFWRISQRIGVYNFLVG